MNIQDFENWFEKPIQAMNADQHGGFAVLMLTLPLAERYFRIKTGMGDGTLTTAFHTAFGQSFNLSEQQSKEFWQVYRNGLLHQATFSRENRHGTIMPAGWIMAKTTVLPDTVNYVSASNEFILHPKEFSEEIIRIIKGDFATFDAPGDLKHPPLEVGTPLAFKKPQPFSIQTFLPPGSGS